jgi:leucyl aminopeptidase
MDLGGGAKVLGLIMLRATRRPNKDFFGIIRCAESRESDSL